MSSKDSLNEVRNTCVTKISSFQKSALDVKIVFVVMANCK